MSIEVYKGIGFAIIQTAEGDVAPAWLTRMIRRSKITWSGVYADEEA